MSVFGLARPNLVKIDIEGVPASVSDSAAALFTSRVDRAARSLIEDHQLETMDVTIRCGQKMAHKGLARPEALRTSDQAELGTAYAPQVCLPTTSLLVLPAEVSRRLDAAVKLIQLESMLFDQWGLREIEPRPKAALNFHGPPGTGKTLAAHWMASTLGRKILSASCADLESAFHGQGPKNIAQLFRTAENEDAVVFLDEADSLASKRIAHVTQGADQVINTMRSQLLLSLDSFRGLVVFATNAVAHYDPAFDTRVEHVHFPVPDLATRMALWKRHLPSRLPLEGVSLDRLAEVTEGMVGRDIKNSVIAAAVEAAITGAARVTEAELLNAVERIKRSWAEKEAATPFSRSSHRPDQAEHP